MNLSDHFTLEEMTVTGTGLDNSPSELQLENIKSLCAGLEAIRNVLQKPIKVSSGFRSKAVNSAVGGVDSSAHVFGYAADFTVARMTNKEICEAIVKAGIKFDQLIDESKGGRQWVHISFDPRLRQQWLIFSNGKYEIHK